MDIQVWDSINSSSNSSPKYIYVESNDILEMTFDVEQIDIIQLKVWMDAEVYLDAYPDEVYYWRITEINTIPNTNSSTTTYPVTITGALKCIKQVSKWRKNVFMCTILTFRQILLLFLHS